MTTSGNQAARFRISQEPLPVPAMEEIAQVPSLSSDGQSFVVIRSAADLDLFEDNDLSHISMLKENEKLYQEELAQILGSNHLQPSSNPASIVKPSTTKESNTIDHPQASSDTKDSFESLPNSLGPLKPADNKMNQSYLPAMPQPHQIYPGLGADEHDSRAISIVSFSPNDFGSEEIQAKVTQLIDENMHLKDTIIQNNLSMKTQYERIVAWQNDVTKVHEAHKEKFREAKKCIETLKEENATIKQENENLKYNLQIQKTEHDKTKKLLTDTSENNLKEFQLDMANKKIKELEQGMKNMQVGENQASYNWKAMEEKLQRYENELEQAYKKIREMEKGAEDQDNLALQIDELKLTKEKLLLAEMTIENKNEELAALRKHLPRCVKESKERDQLIIEVAQLKKQLDISEMSNEQAKKKMDSLMNRLAKNQTYTSEDTVKIQEALSQAVIECNQLKEELEYRNSTILTSQLKIKKLEEDLEKANDAVEEYKQAAQISHDKEEHAALNAWMIKQKMTELEQKYQLLQQNIEQARPQHAPNIDELSYIRQQLMQSQKAFIESEQNRAVSEAQVRKLMKENAELVRQLENRQTQSDDDFALKQQLEVYKTDFEAEREAKEDVKREKNKIAEDLQHLHRRNQQLQEEIEILREQQQFTSGAPGRREFARPQASAPSREEYIYRCPKCDFGFKTLNAVENHVVRCIELDDSLP